MKEIVLDTETTGLSITEGHRIVEIGCIELENYVPTNKIFHCYLNPERKVSDQAFKIHGYTDKFLSSKSKFNEINDDFLNFIEGKKLIIHNAEFDLAHINNELKIIGKKSIRNEIIDTLDLARDKFPGSQINLDALCKRFRIDNTRRKLHNALIDCELLSKVYINLIDQKEPTLNFEKESIQTKNENNKLDVKYFDKIISPNKSEMEEHKIFLKNSLKKNFY
ncbi:MAG: DNA polymerase III subunit epsilon [Pelagibacteraceae bacterium TMED246]|nr:MAG: DNA polymerase III subunit epsilon [Pelagibacteraceae bacterium TMED246]|tara:strand:+ start:26229 stop:26894 length:666 start_codon:yes stop_codon:yes gene_type:complete